MSEDEQRGVCAVCAQRGATGTISMKSEKHPERTYRFYIHRECFKEIAKPGFVGLNDV